MPTARCGEMKHSILEVKSLSTLLHRQICASSMINPQHMSDLPTIPILSGQSRFEPSNPDNFLFWLNVPIYFGEMPRYFRHCLGQYNIQGLTPAVAWGK